MLKEYLTFIPFACLLLTPKTRRAIEGLTLQARFALFCLAGGCANGVVTEQVQLGDGVCQHSGSCCQS